MEDVIELLRERSEDIPTPLELPEDDDLVLVQEQILIHLPDEYKIFLKEVSDVVCGSLEPATVTDENSHTYLPEMTSIAWDIGMPRELITICEAPDGYYCIEQDGVVRFWDRDEGLTEDEWPTIWHWARDIWLES
ncbi:SMI1/KNR4 family protein [Sansalvadorimonas sp. 2012CJ34-2]|uniref:SMI1/KNR4 family protein n=1 Tax=Parendozoicomonas callyspongiae TaxID=2942213 RepID=A0ABT0PM58_9GAMM|nr:SMI1/KNR4 family protein [Sansalvadorimonas sp. 2012CJ34-2]MCL6271543.1 SMI1/KNR4 family protein [Sansalvadorimonas sp. 2012CJ34-2]